MATETETDLTIEATEEGEALVATEMAETTEVVEATEEEGKCQFLLKRVIGHQDHSREE